jgi:hypothetical protein
MKENKKILEAARLIESLGAVISYVSFDGHFSVSPEDLVEIANDADGWLSKRYGITRSRHVEWRAYMQDSTSQCTGRTRSGKRCRGRGKNYPGAAEFTPGFHDRCPLHRESLGVRDDV